VSKERVIVLSVVQQQLSKAETARRYQVSWRWVHTLVTRYQTGGWEAVEARSRRPHNNSRAVAAALRERICTLRCELQAAGLDHGPVSIAARLSHEGLRPPSVFHNLPHPHQRRLDQPGTEEAAQKLLSAIPSRPAQRVLAIRLHPLAASRQHRCGDHQLA
jgi:hypothetical protein